MRRAIEDLKIVAEEPTVTVDPGTPGSTMSETAPEDQKHIRVQSQFQLSSPRMWKSPPSPRTVETVPTVPQPETVDNDQDE